MSPSKNNVRRGSQWEPSEVPPFMTNGIANLYAERESPIPNVMTSPALLPDSSYQDDGHLKTGYNCNGATSKKISEEDLSCSSNDLPTPPDGGWGWMVVFASFMIHIIADGITYSFGIVVKALLNGFEGSSRAEVSFIPSILVGVTLGAGPIASSLTNRFGCRAVTIMGAIIAAIGLACSAAATSILFLYISVGLVTGFGFGLIYLPAIVSVSMYFEKRRAFATGIAVCGSGVGTFVMAPVTTALINHFEWNGTFLILGAIVLFNIILGALFRPLLPSSSASEATTTSNQDAVNLDCDVTSSLYKISDKENGNFSLQNSFTNGTNPNDMSISCNASFIDSENNAQKSPEIKINGEPLGPMATPWIGFNHHLGKSDGKYSEFARMALSHPVLPSQPPEGPMAQMSGSHSKIYEQRSVPHTSRHHRSRHDSGVMFRKDILYGGSLYNIPEYKNNPRRYSRHLSRQTSAQSHEGRKEKEDMESSTTDCGNQDKICGCIPAGRDAAKAFKEMMDFSLLKDGIFIMFAISNFLTSIGFNVPYVYTADRAEKFGFSKEDASVLLMVIGIANTGGRIVLGFISDRGWIKRLYLYNICLAVCGLGMGFSNFCTDLHTQRLFCALFGITSGAYVGLTSVVLVDLLGLDKLTNAFGLLLLFQGIASVMGPPIIGWLYDATGSYDIGFYFAGVMIFLSGVMLFAIPWIENKRNLQNIKENGFPDIERYVNPEEGIIEVDEDDEEEDDPDHKPFTMKT